jgi:hypothetical protein
MALDRTHLLAHRLADLHAIANELEIEHFRLLRKGDLADAIAGTLASKEQSRAGTKAEPPRSRRERRVSRSSRRRRGFGLPPRE